MPDKHEEHTPDEQQPQPPITYASPVKRTWAWVGIVYMLLILCTFTYHLATATYLIGIGPLLLCPAVAGMAVTAVLRFRAGQGRGGLPACIITVGVCAALIVFQLITGIPALLQNF